MNETEWLESQSPEELLGNFPTEGHRIERKMRLVAVACCEARFGRRLDRGLAESLTLATRLADDRTVEAERAGMFQRRSLDPRTVTGALLNWHGFQAVARTLQVLGAGWVYGHSLSSTPEHIAAYCQIIRDIMGNPFHAVAFAPDWQTSTAIAIARQMYDTRDFAAMPILADALQDAGCEEAAVLDHCRGPGSHVRGCWVVDHVLARS
jgi:hypothetical protein